MNAGNQRGRVRRTGLEPAFLSASAAIDRIWDGATVAIGGSGGGVVEPDLLIGALGDRFAATGHPAGLTLVHTTGIGDRNGSGMDRLAQPGLARRIIAGNWGMAPRMSRLALAGAFEAYNFPQGVVSQLFREIAGHRPGVITKVGLGTFCDPRRGGGRLNPATTEELVQIVHLVGEEWLLYPAFPIDACLIRGTTADEDGNLSLEQEAARLDTLAMAQATRNSGGLVIAQVRQVARRHGIDARAVVVPGICVDVVVRHPEQRQVVTHTYNPSFSGEVRTADIEFEDFPLDHRKVVCRRACAEIRDGDVVNLGVGIADGIAGVAAEQRLLGRFTLTVEQGLVGGIPARGVIFGAARNPGALLDEPAQFDFYDGGGLDIAFLGMGQVDRHGNVNVSLLGDRLIGAGGFINISQNVRTVVFCGTFTAGGLRTRVGDGQIRIEQEGAHCKFVEQG